MRERVPIWTIIRTDDRPWPWRWCALMALAAAGLLSCLCWIGARCTAAAMPKESGTPQRAGYFEDARGGWRWSIYSSRLVSAFEVFRFDFPANARWGTSSDMPGWTGVAAGGVTQSSSESARKEYASGWPARCLIADVRAMPAQPGDAGPAPVGLAGWRVHVPGLAFDLGLVLACGAAPLALTLLRRAPGYVRIARLGPGHCRRCGYDLGGLKAGSRCPECGFGRNWSRADVAWWTRG
jgi:hypothetical protein